GKGLGAWLLVRDLPAKADPLGPENELVFSTGPANGTLIPGSARMACLFKSPLTGIWGESYCGGSLAPELKKAGFDALVVRGRAEGPVLLVVEDGGAELRPADHLWGLDTFETEEAIREELGPEFQVMCIGPAGERLVRIACICHAEGRQFGRCGCGAVMGSKRLKAIAIHGTNEVEVARPDEVRELASELREKAREVLRGLSRYGTPGIMARTNATETLPTRNWSEGSFPGYERIGPKALVERLFVRSKACPGCPVGCGKISEVREGPYACRVEGPEYETLFALGPLCYNEDLESIAKMNELCDRLGLDTISTGNAIAFSMELYERGIIGPGDTDGLDLRFGNHEAMVELVRRIALREGWLGDLLAEGVARASRAIGRGSERYAVHVKGLEPPGYDPRGLKGMALAYAVSARGACHLRHVAYRPNLTGQHPFKPGVEVDRLSYEGQAEMVVELEDFYALVDSMVICRFLCLPTIGPILWEELRAIYSATTGLDVGVGELRARGAEINDLVRWFNVREGIDRRHDTLPDRFFEEPVAGQVVDRRAFEQMLDEYYALRGWDEEGKPRGPPALIRDRS
ncbi:aldehyde:ferredoxin oxidoreductase, partial [Candidatus Bathyarchaeota archaeon]